VTFAARVATTDTELFGVPVPEGALIEVGIGPANRDPARWDDPERFDPARPQQGHLAFSTGPHFCVGMQVARLEMERGLNRLLDRLPDLRLDPAAEAPTITGLWYRMPTAVPVLWG
jgi:cytochrome P450